MEAEPSLTAIGAASTRASHLLFDAEPKIFHDQYALALCSDEDEKTFRNTVESGVKELAAKIGEENAQRLVKSVRGSVVLRSRFTEDAFRRALQRGVRHLIILGAGLDSFAWRYPELSDDIHVYEIDHPASQQWKRERLRKLGLKEPKHLTFVPIDFEKQTLTQGLLSAGFSQQTPGFFSWLGVIPYLKWQTVLDTLRQVAAFGKGSEIGYTALVKETLMTEDDRQVYSMTAAGAAARNEPFLCLVDPAELTRQLREMGYRHIEDLDWQDANATYMANRSDGLRVASMEHMMLART
jgi:methyltransferase (TIGR00027 family)